MDASFLTPRQTWVLSEAGRVFVHDLRGTTFNALLVDLVVFVTKKLAESKQYRTKTGWGSALKAEWDNSGKYYLVATLAVYAIAFVICLSDASKRRPTFTPQQISEYAKGIAVQVANRNISQSTNLIAMDGTGCWISTNGFVLTCVPFSNISSNETIIVAPVPPLLEGPMIGLGQFTAGMGVFLHYDDQTKMALFWSSANPFKRDLHMVAKTVFPKTGKVIGVEEQYRVPEISKEMAKVGEDVYLVCVESHGVEFTTRTVSGRVERIGTDRVLGQGGRILRIYTSIPYLPIYRGAPVLDASEQLVGIAEESDSGTIIIPSTYILEIRKEFNAMHTF